MPGPATGRRISTKTKFLAPETPSPGKEPLPAAETPTEYMTRVMNDPNVDAKRRDAMALKLFAIHAKEDKIATPGGEQTKVAIRKFYQPVE